MKRFYCEVCKKVKRVRKLPSSNNHFTIQQGGKLEINNFTKPEERNAICDRHIIQADKIRQSGRR